MEGHLDGSVVEHLLSAQSMTLGSWYQVLHQATWEDPASPSAYLHLCLSLCVSHE